MMSDEFLLRLFLKMLSALQALVVTFTFLFGLGGRSQYFYAIMLTIMSLNALALCQVTNFQCLFCNEEGSPHYYAARVLSICLGCLAPMLVSKGALLLSASSCAAVCLHCSAVRAFVASAFSVHDMPAEKL